MVYELSRIAVDGQLLCCCHVFGRGCDCAWLKASILVVNVDLQMRQVNLKAAFFKLRRSGGNNSALTSIQTKQGAKDDSIKNDRGSFVHSLFKRVLENLIFNDKQGIYKGE